MPLRERLAHVREVQKAPLEPKVAAELPHARKRMSAELAFVTFAESIRQAALGKGAGASHRQLGLRDLLFLGLRQLCHRCLGEQEHTGN